MRMDHLLDIFKLDLSSDFVLNTFFVVKKRANTKKAMSISCRISKISKYIKYRSLNRNNSSEIRIDFRLLGYSYWWSHLSRNWLCNWQEAG